MPGAGSEVAFEAGDEEAAVTGFAALARSRSRAGPGATRAAARPRSRRVAGILVPSVDEVSVRAQDARYLGRRRHARRPERRGRRTRRGRGGSARPPCLKATRPWGSSPTLAPGFADPLRRAIDARAPGRRETRGRGRERARRRRSRSASARSGGGTCSTAAASGVRRRGVHPAMISTPAPRVDPLGFPRRCRRRGPTAA